MIVYSFISVEWHVVVFRAGSLLQRSLRDFKVLEKIIFASRCA